MDIAITASKIGILKLVFNREIDFIDDNSFNELCSEVNSIKMYIDRGIKFVFFGHSFCQYRMPKKNQVKQAVAFCHEKNLTFVLLTPPVTNFGLKVICEIVDFFIENDYSFDIVVNDLGVLQYLQKCQYKGNICFGRIMDKTIRDSRLDINSEECFYTNDGREYMRSLASTSLIYQKFLNDNGVSVIEVDCSYKCFLFPSNIKIDLYFPTEYLTTGRMCLFRIASQNEKEKFILNDYCGHLCSQKMEIIRLNSDTCDVKGCEHRRLFRNGNTLYSLHLDLLQDERDINRLIIDIDFFLS